MENGKVAAAYRAYEPLDRLKPFADEVWVADGPEIRMRYLGTSLPFPTRMTVVRLGSGAVWVHSPIAWHEGLGEAVGRLGPVRFLVAPNTLHYWYLPDWQDRWPDALSYGSPGLGRRARRPVRLDAVLGDAAPEAWAGELEQCLVPGRLLTEVAFFHRASRTLILTDLIENFEPEKLSLPMRVLTWIGAAQGSMPRDMRLTYGDRVALISAVETMISWQPERIVVAHGGIYGRDGTAALKRAFSWLLD